MKYVPLNTIVSSVFINIIIFTFRLRFWRFAIFFSDALDPSSMNVVIIFLINLIGCYVQHKITYKPTENLSPVNI